MSPGALRMRGASAPRALLADPSSRLLLASVAMAAAAFVANLLAARSLGPSGRGELALLLQIAYMSSLGLLLGTDRSVVAVYSGQAPAQAVRAFARLLARPVAVGLVVAAALAAAPLPGLGDWRHRVALAAVFAVVNALVRATRAIAVATGRTGEYLACTVLSQVLLLGFLVALAGTTSSAVWITAYIVAGLLANLAFLARWWRIDVAPDGGRHGPAPTVAAARREGLVLLPYALSESGMLRLDRLILPLLASTAALGVYASVGTMTELLAWPFIALADARLGVWRRAWDEGRLATAAIVRAAVGYAAAGAVVLGLALSVSVVPLLGPEFAAARDLVVPLVLAAAVYGVSRVLVTLLVARRRGGLASTADVIGLVGSVALYVALIPPFGALGAAWASLIGYGVGAAAAAVFLAASARSSPVVERHPTEDVARVEPGPDS